MLVYSIGDLIVVGVFGLFALLIAFSCLYAWTAMGLSWIKKKLTGNGA